MLVGLVGKPNVGKSSFFRAATLAHVASANYPFVTIKPNHGTAYVKTWCASNHFQVTPNPREGYYAKGWRFVPFDLMDVAGLVPGAHEGLGMGNAFLDDLRQADVLIHVVDAAGATNEKGEPLDPGTYDPLKDVAFLEYELDMWYFQILERGFDKFARTLVQTHGNLVVQLAKQLSGLGVTEIILKYVLEKKVSLLEVAPTLWTVEQKKEIAKQLRLITKPIMIAANRVDIPIAQTNVARLKQAFPHLSIIACSAEAEIMLREAAKKELISYIPGDKTFTVLKDVSPQQKSALDLVQKSVLDVWGSTGVQQVLNEAVFGFLKYITVYPGGVNKLGDSQGRILPDCYLMKPQSTAIDFARKIHSDLADHFIRAIDVKTKKTVGKDHLLHDGDVVEIVSSK
jgi:ribosome-binding ATPase